MLIRPDEGGVFVGGGGRMHNRDGENFPEKNFIPKIPFVKMLLTSASYYRNFHCLFHFPLLNSQLVTKL